MSEAKRWKVSYEDIQAKMSRRPFWKLFSYVEADTRDIAIRQVRAKFAPPQYGNYRARRDKRHNDEEVGMCLTFCRSLTPMYLCSTSPQGSACEVVV